MAYSQSPAPCPAEPHLQECAVRRLAKGVRPELQQQHNGGKAEDSWQGCWLQRHSRQAPCLLLGLLMHEIAALSSASHARYMRHTLCGSCEPEFEALAFRLQGKARCAAFMANMDEMVRWNQQANVTWFKASPTGCREAAVRPSLQGRPAKARPFLPLIAALQPCCPCAGPEQVLRLHLPGLQKQVPDGRRARRLHHEHDAHPGRRQRAPQPPVCARRSQAAAGRGARRMGPARPGQGACAQRLALAVWQQEGTSLLVPHPAYAQATATRRVRPKPLASTMTPCTAGAAAAGPGQLRKLLGVCW